MFTAVGGGSWMEVNWMSSWLGCQRLTVQHQPPQLLLLPPPLLSQLIVLAQRSWCSPVALQTNSSYSSS
jgi:hypothetical protein